MKLLADIIKWIAVYEWYHHIIGDINQHLIVAYHQIIGDFSKDYRLMSQSAEHKTQTDLFV